MERFEEFERDGKNIVYIDFSGIKYNEEFIEAAKVIHSAIKKYLHQSVYTITNIENIRFDSNSKELISDFLKNNAPYVKCGVIIGLDGIKKMMIKTVMKLSGRTNLYFAFTKEGAIDWILRQE